MTVHFNQARGRWCYDFQRGGKRYASYADHPETGTPARSKRQAVEHEALIRARVIGDEAKERADARRSHRGVTLAEVLAYYAEHRAVSLRSWRNSKAHIAELLAYFGAGALVEALTPTAVRAFATQATAQEARRYVGGCDGVRALYKGKGATRSASTVNKVLNTLRAAFRLALRDELVRRAPDVPRLTTPEDVPAPIPVSDLRIIMDAAGQHLRDAITLCALTGMRTSECLELEWRQVDLARGVIILEAEGTKAGKGRVVYLHPLVRATLERIEKERPLPLAPEQRVILYRHKGVGAPRPIADLHTAWYAALTRVGLKGRYKFHGTRATFCTLLAGQGLDPAHIKELAGHTSIATTMRYVQATQTRLQEGVALLDDAAAALSGGA